MFSATPGEARSQAAATTVGKGTETNNASKDVQIADDACGGQEVAARTGMGPLVDGRRGNATMDDGRGEVFFEHERCCRKLGHVNTAANERTELSEFKNAEASPDDNDDEVAVVRYIVQWKEFYQVSEHQQVLSSALSSLRSRHCPTQLLLERENRATLTFPSDFAILALPLHDDYGDSPNGCGLGSREHQGKNHDQVELPSCSECTGGEVDQESAEKVGGGVIGRCYRCCCCYTSDQAELLLATLRSSPLVKSVYRDEARQMFFFFSSFLFSCFW